MLQLVKVINIILVQLIVANLSSYLFNIPYSRAVVMGFIFLGACIIVDFVLTLFEFFFIKRYYES